MGGGGADTILYLLRDSDRSTLEYTNKMFDQAAVRDKLIHTVPNINP